MERQYQGETPRGYSTVTIFDLDLLLFTEKRPDRNIYFLTVARLTDHEREHLLNHLRRVTLELKMS